MEAVDVACLVPSLTHCRAFPSKKKHLPRWEGKHSLEPRLSATLLDPPFPPSLLPSLLPSLPLGVDPLTSNSLQAKFSYKWEDVQWRSAFAPCLLARHHDGGCVLDVAKFHQTQRVG